MSSPSIITRRAGITWALLVLVTILNPFLSDGHTASGAAMAAVLVLAAVKVRLVGLDFMELRHAPLAMRLAFEGYCLALATTLVVVYLTT